MDGKRFSSDTSVSARYRETTAWLADRLGAEPGARKGHRGMRDCGYQI
jgi:hypothetical protein